MQTYTYANFGYNGNIINVECDTRKGMPAVDIVGLADGAVKESRERMRAAISNSGLELPSERILISLSPTDLRKEGASYDLPIALSVLARMKDTEFSIPDENGKPALELMQTIDEKVLAIGELTLSGQTRPVRGVYAAVMAAKEAGITKIICDKFNAEEIKNIPGIEIGAVSSLNEAYNLMTKQTSFAEPTPEKEIDNQIVTFCELEDEEKEVFNSRTFSKVAMEAIEIAVAGKHNLALTGAPGCGKTLAIQTVPYLTPELTEEEAKENDKIYSIAGLSNIKNHNKAPFRMPHQTATIEGIAGGGAFCRPGEITLANNGVLFLDETMEFRSSVLQLLRVPLESKQITLTRAGHSTVFPAKFQLMMAKNPCPCGNFGCDGKICLCSSKAVELYNNKTGLPLNSRMEINAFINTDDKKIKYDLEKGQNKIKTAYEIQRKRGVFNADLNMEQISKYCELDEKSMNFYETFTMNHDLTSREATNLLKVSLTVANMDGREKIQFKDLKQASEYAISDIAKMVMTFSPKKEKEQDSPAHGR